MHHAFRGGADNCTADCADRRAERTTCQANYATGDRARGGRATRCGMAFVHAELLSQEGLAVRVPRPSFLVTSTRPGGGSTETWPTPRRRAVRRADGSTSEPGRAY